MPADPEAQLYFVLVLVLAGVLLLVLLAWLSTGRRLDRAQDATALVRQQLAIMGAQAKFWESAYRIQLDYLGGRRVQPVEQTVEMPAVEPTEAV